MAFLNVEKVSRDFTISGKEFHNFIVEGKKDLELIYHPWPGIEPNRFSQVPRAKYSQEFKLE
jgi:hypothetical protein